MEPPELCVALGSSSPARAMAVQAQTQSAAKAAARAVRTNPWRIDPSRPASRLRKSYCGITLTLGTGELRPGSWPGRHPTDYAAVTPHSGRFCGTPVPDRFIQKSHDSRNNRHVGEVKYIPTEGPAAYFRVQQHEIHDPRPVQPVDGIAHRAADDHPERQGRQPGVDPGQPDPQKHH